MNWEVCDTILVLSKISSLSVVKGQLLDCPDSQPSTWLLWLNQLLPLALAKEKGGLLEGGELEKLQELSMLPPISHPRGALQVSIA